MEPQALLNRIILHMKPANVSLRVIPSCLPGLRWTLCSRGVTRADRLAGTQDSAHGCDRLLMAVGGQVSDDGDCLLLPMMPLPRLQVLTETASQADVYHAAVQPIVEDVLNGYNGTIMAYGQTGAGKTYTLSSRDPDAIGMMPRAAAAIFSAIEHDQGHSYTVMMSYIQLYMELLQVHAAADARLRSMLTPGCVRQWLLPFKHAKSENDVTFSIRLYVETACAMLKSSGCKGAGQ